MSGCKRKLAELDGGPGSASPETRRVRPVNSRSANHEASRSGQQSGTTGMPNSRSYRALELLPAEILLSIFTRCRNPYLGHVSSRVHQFSPPFHETTRSLAGFAMAALPFKDRHGQPVDLNLSPVYHIACDLYGSQWVDCPKTSEDHTLLRREVCESHWFTASMLESVHLLTYRKVLDRILLDKGFFTYLNSPIVQPHQHFRLSRSQKDRVRQFIKKSTEIDPSKDTGDLSLRTENDEGLPMQIDVHIADICFRRRNDYDEMYLITSFDYLPAFLYDAPLTRRTALLFLLVQLSDRGDPRVPPHMPPKDGRGLSCSRDKLRGLINRVIDDDLDSEVPKFLSQVLFIEQFCFRDRGEVGIVDFGMFRRAAFLDRRDLLHILFDYAKDNDKLQPCIVTSEKVGALKTELEAHHTVDSEVLDYLDSILASLFCKQIGGAKFKDLTRGANKKRGSNGEPSSAEMYQCVQTMMRIRAGDAGLFRCCR